MKRKNAFYNTTFLIAVLAAVNAQQQAVAEDHVTVGVGFFDVYDRNGAADIRLEYRNNRSIILQNLKPWAGMELTSDASLWLGGGLRYDWNIHKSFYITSSIGAGYYAQGHSDKELDFPVQFRSQLEFSYAFNDTSRLGLAISHLSNASLGDTNQGTEIFTLYHSFPLNELF